MTYPNFDIVVATRNRRDALELSLPLFATQSARPDQIIVVDSSDDHVAMATFVTGILSRFQIPFKIHRASKASLVLQRNEGLMFCQAEIVFFPDDDSLWFKNTAEECLRIYANQAYGALIGGVSATETRTNPANSVARYKVSNAEKLKAIFGKAKKGIEDLLFPRPFDSYCRLYGMKGNLRARDSISKLGPVLENMGGFRMSFRRSALLAAGSFDEALGEVIGYSQHEDIDASMRVQRLGFFLVGADAAHVCHYKFPGVRSRGLIYGFCQFMNMIYIMGKFPEYNAMRGTIRRYLKWKLFLYRLAAKSDFGIDRFKGASYAYKQFVFNDNPISNSTLVSLTRKVASGDLT